MVQTEVAAQPCDASWLEQYSRDFRRVKPMYGTANCYSENPQNDFVAVTFVEALRSGAINRGWNRSSA